MNNLFAPMPFWRTPVFAPEDGGGAAPAADDAGTVAAAGDATAAGAAAKWYESADFDDDHRAWLAARGLNTEDQNAALVKLAKGHRAAEQRLGRGVDTIIDKPAKGQSIAEWAKANGDALGLPKDIEGYKVERPADYPKDLIWDEALDAKAQQLALENGIPPEFHKAYVGMFANYMAEISNKVDADQERANTELRSELTREWGKEYEAKAALAAQAMNHFATEAGLTEDSMTNALAAMTKDLGDAAVVKLFATIGAAMGEDKAISIGNGGSLGMTPADARREMQAMTKEGGELWLANDAVRKGESGATARLKAAQARQKQLAQIAAPDE